MSIGTKRCDFGTSGQSDICSLYVRESREPGSGSVWIFRFPTAAVITIAEQPFLPKAILPDSAKDWPGWW
jgi:hypothetical protein